MSKDITEEQRKKNLLQSIVALRDNPHFIELKVEIDSLWYQAKQGVIDPARETSKDHNGNVVRGDVAPNAHLVNTGIFQAYDSILSLIENPELVLV